VISCGSCLHIKNHFTEVEGVAYICDDCVREGRIPWTREPDDPGVTQPLDKIVVSCPHGPS